MAKVVRSFKTSTYPAPVLRGAGWQVTERDGVLEATQGSQWRTRILGGWFVGLDALPKHLEGLHTAAGDYEITASSAFGFGYVDPRFRRRYEAAFDNLETLLPR